MTNRELELELEIRALKYKVRELGRKHQNVLSWLAHKGIIEDDGTDLAEKIRRDLEEG